MFSPLFGTGKRAFSLKCSRSRNSIRSGVILLALSSGLVRPSAADTVNWTLGANGNWNVAGNWTDSTTLSNVVPGTGDTAAIGAFTVNLTSGSFNVGGLNTSSTNLSSGTLSVSGASSFGGSTILDTTTFNANGTAAIANSSRLLLRGGTTLSTNTLNVGNGSVLSIQETASGSPTLNITNFLFNGVSPGNAGSVYFEGRTGFTPTYTLNSGQTFTGNIAGIGDSISVNGNSSTLNTAATFNLNASGTTTQFGGVVSAVNNSGTIRSSNGNNILIQPNTFTNSGTVDVGVGTTLRLVSGEQQTAGNTHVDGNLAIDSGRSLTLSGGTLTGSGTIGPNSGTISVINNGGTVNPGNSPGTLTLQGNYTQGASGSLFIDLGSAASDLFNVSGSAVLDGTLDINLFGGFLPSVGQNFTFLNYGSHTGFFSNIVSLNPGYGYSVAYNGSNAVLSVTAAASATPEPGVWAMLAGLGLTTMSVLRRRKR